MRNLDTGLLRGFVAVADTASMTAAANALHLTQGAVSQQIRRLEDLFGAPLFVRNRQGLTLTRAGERLLGKARRFLALNDEIWSEMTAPDFTGTVRLGVPYDLVGTVLPPVLKSFAGACPNVAVSLMCEASPVLVAAAAAGTVDLALVEQPVGEAGGECLAVDRLVWVGARNGTAYRKRPLPISLVSERCAFRGPLLAALDRDGLDWVTVFENANIDATRAAVGMDLAVSAWLASTVPAGLDILHREAGLPALPGFAIGLYRSKALVNPAADELARHLRDGFLGRLPGAA